MLRIDKKNLRPTFTCAICSNLIDQATAIMECLHTFCWKCIYGKIIEQDCKSCPECYVDLGPKPLEKLRHDRLLEKLVRQLFPPKQDDVKTESKTYEGSSSSSIDINK